LNNQLSAEEIASGHAFDKHVIDQDEFGGTITTQQQFADQIENILNNPSATKQLSNGRFAYWDDSSGMVVIRNPNAADGGTAFKPTNGKAYFNNLR
jgi:filamentous hemagglutinin